MGARSIALFLLSLGVFGGGLSYYLKQKKDCGSDAQSVAGSLFMPGVKQAQDGGAAGTGAPAGVAPAVAQSGGSAPVEALTKIGSGISGKRAATIRSSGVGDLVEQTSAPAAPGGSGAPGVAVAGDSGRGEDAARIAALERANQSLRAEIETLRQQAAQRKAEPAAVAAGSSALRARCEQCAELEKQKKLISGELSAVRAEFAAAFGESLKSLGKNDEALRRRALAYQKLNERREKEFAELTQEYKLHAAQLRAEVEQLEKQLALMKPKPRKP